MTWTRSVLAAAVPVAAVAVIAGVVSYSHIEALGLATGQTLTDARLLPLAVDGLIVAGSVILLAGSWLGWIGVVLGVSGTVYANVMSGLPRGPLAATVAAWPALAFTVASFMLERWLAGQVKPEQPEPVTARLQPGEQLEQLGGVPEGVPGVPGPGYGLNGHAHQSAELFASDLAVGKVPGIRRIRSALHVGQPKAKQVQAYLKTLTEGTAAPDSASDTALITAGQNGHISPRHTAQEG